MPNTITNAMSVDLEDWYHPELVRNVVAENEKTSRLQRSVPLILELFSRYHVKATFFVLGEVAERNQDLIQQIANEGHEIASHGFSHRPLHELTPKSFDEELAKTEDRIVQAGGPERLLGFRAPTFSLNQKTAWALEVLAARGYRYDSSIFPLKNHVYGVQGAPTIPYRPDRSDIRSRDPKGRIVEFPLTIYGRAPFALPLCGGFYLRVLPFLLVKKLISRLNAKGRSVVIYFHPWEMDKELPRYSLRQPDRFITYFNLGTTYHKIEKLLESFKFAPLHQVLQL